MLTTSGLLKINKLFLIRYPVPQLKHTGNRLGVYSWCESKSASGAPKKSIKVHEWSPKV